MLFGETDIIELPQDVGTCSQGNILKRWQPTPLQDIWVPLTVLSNRKSVGHKSEEQGVQRILERLPGIYLKNSFSVYSENDYEDLFLSDSEEDFSISCDEVNSTTINNLSPEVQNNNTSENISCSSFPFTDSLDRCSNSNLALVPSDESGLENENLAEVSRVANEFHDDRDIQDAILLPNKFSDSEIMQSKVHAKKEKKNKSKIPKSMPLDNFLRTVDSSNVPEVDEFYESVMRNAYMDKHMEINNPSEFPFLNNVFANLSEIQKTSASRNDKNLCRSSNASESEKYHTPIINQIATANIEETIGEDIFKKILIMENIPNDVPEESIASILFGYGELKDIRKNGEFLTAEFSLTPETDEEWILSCFNGHQPFGAYSTVLQCSTKVCYP